MKMQILDKTKKKKFIEKISKFGIGKLPYLFIKTGAEKIRAYSGSLSNEEVYRLSYLLNIEGIGIYFGKEYEGGARLNLDVLHLGELKKQIKQNIIELNKSQENDWFHGKEIELTKEQIEKYKNMKDFVILKSDSDFIGTGKIYADKTTISNFMPKERRIKQK